MGLIKAIGGAASGTLADQWQEFFTLDSMPPEILLAKGQKTINSRSSNTKGSENVISSGSGIVVADGQAVAIINNGIVVEFAAEPGMYTFDSSTTPSIFADTGGFGANLLASFKDGIERFQRGGGVYQDQRVYYFNIKEIIGNKYGTAEPIAYRVVDADIGLDMDVDLRCNGEFSYKLTNPILFYQNVAGNVPGDYSRDMIDSQLKAELLTGLNAALAAISAQGIRYSALPGHALEIGDNLNQVLSNRWRDLRGIEVVSFAVNSVSITDEDEKRIKDLQAMKSLRDPGMAGAALVAAQADAMRSAAENEGGAAIGFLGLGLASQAGGTAATASELLAGGQAEGQALTYPTAPDGGFAVGSAPVAPAPVAPAPVAPAPVAPPPPAPGTAFAAVAVPSPDAPVPPAAAAAPAPVSPALGSWDCPACGLAGNTGNFCSNCGTAKPGPVAWACPTCGQDGNLGNFCSNCGTAKP